YIQRGRRRDLILLRRSGLSDFEGDQLRKSDLSFLNCHFSFVIVFHLYAKLMVDRIFRVRSCYFVDRSSA
ncbi:MAG TPA: hypothetical protein VFP47_14640, partial [Pyrinomonadaceae bacterium]|nr:hypothetical protein [Pyrinomonadaceae bacterium]